MTGFRTDITSSVWNFCRWDADVHPREMSPAERSVEKRLFSQAYCGREAMWMVHMQCYVASRRKWRLFSRRDRRADVHVKLRKNLLSWWEDTTKRYETAVGMCDWGKRRGREWGKKRRKLDVPFVAFPCARFFLRTLSTRLPRGKCKAPFSEQFARSPNQPWLIPKQIKLFSQSSFADANIAFFSVVSVSLRKHTRA